MSDRTNTNVTIELLHPNFENELEEYFHEMIEGSRRPYLIQHVCKRPRPSDEKYQNYWSQVDPEQYDEWLSK
ncbi:hypothetical protein [Candidatus Protochlamydia sp. R18]|uniref:hypothetical protein n=1 Tax=Candidatus Protochlamydia sp. R18 TaxID=1353977 RepID=UPI0011DE2907|nr:hypothetical protein [Candidatus Protochlamydia sp. R18]